MEEGNPTDKVDVDDSGNATGSDTMVSALAPMKGQGLPDTTNPSGTEGFWDKNKTWLQPTVIGVGVLATAFLLFKMMPKKTEKQSGVAGMGGVKKKKQKGGDDDKKTPIALM